MIGIQKFICFGSLWKKERRHRRRWCWHVAQDCGVKFPKSFSRFHISFFLPFIAPSSVANIWQCLSLEEPVWPDWAIYCTLDNFSKPVATISLPKSPTFLDNFCKGVKIFHFSSEIIFRNFNRYLATFYWSHCEEPT